MSTPKRCGHTDCRCPRAGPDTPYCGPYCANSAEGEALPGEAELEGSCSCGHQACRRRLPDPAGNEIVVSTGR